MRPGPVVLAETRAEFDRLLTRYPTKQAALLPVLWLAQKEWGWISREAVDLVASLLGLSSAFVWGVVTFYTMYNRAPVGKHLIQVCTSISCHLNGAEEVFAECKKRLGDLRPARRRRTASTPSSRSSASRSATRRPPSWSTTTTTPSITKDKLDAFLKGLA